MAVRRVAMRPETGCLDWGDLERSITKRTRLVAIGAASNALGTITDVAAAARARPCEGRALFRRRSPLRAPRSRRRLSHAVRLPRLLGVQVLRAARRDSLGPTRAVGGARRPRSSSRRRTALPIGSRPGRRTTRASSARRPRSTSSPRSARAPRAARGWRARSAGFTSVRSSSRRGSGRGLRPRPGVTLFGPPPSAPRTPTCSFVLAGRPSREVAEQLAHRAVFVSHGDFYALTVARRLGHEGDGLVRIGCSCFTTEEEVDRVVAGVREIAGSRAGGSARLARSRKLRDRALECHAPLLDQPLGRRR